MKEKIKPFLIERIEETKQSYKNGFPIDIGIIKIRKYQFIIKPKKYIKSTDRIGKDEVNFFLQYENESGVSKGITISIHISIERSGGPAISGWIEGRDGNFGWQRIDEKLFSACQFHKMSNWEFFRYWIKRFCKNNDSIIFKYASEIP